MMKLKAGLATQIWLTLVQPAPGHLIFAQLSFVPPKNLRRLWMRPFITPVRRFLSQFLNPQEWN